MEITELLERVIAQNETIIRQNVELLLVLGVLVEDQSKKGETKQDPSPEVGKKPETA